MNEWQTCSGNEQMDQEIDKWIKQENCEHKNAQQEFRGNGYNPSVCPDCGYEYFGFWWEKY